MKVVGTVESLWRYPVKSMRGERLREAFIGFPGVYGDRLYAFRSSASIKGFPYLTGREQAAMLLYRAVYRHPERMAAPVNLAEADVLGFGVTPVYADSADRLVDIETPGGKRFAIDDPELLDTLREGIRDVHELSLMRSERALTDCRPISIFSIQTARQLGGELGVDMDPRRFRASIYVDLQSSVGFGEDQFVGRTLRLGAKAAVTVVGRDSRCKMITLDPETAEPNPEVMRVVARDHEGKAGVYGAVLVEGMVRPGDEIALMD